MKKWISAERTSAADSYSILRLQHLKPYEYIARFISGKSVLELGCGGGFGTSVLAQKAKYIDALDYDKDVIMKNQTENTFRNVNYFRADIGSFIPDKKYDCVVCFQVIEHLKDHGKLLHLVRLALKKGGDFFLTTPNAVTQSYNENPYHFHEFTLGELESIMPVYGFVIKDRLGVFGNHLINQIEKKRRYWIRQILFLDILQIRKLMPLFIRRRIFDLFAYISKSATKSKNSREHGKGKQLFKIQKFSEKAIDIMLICRKP